jgi:hypothetical protein
MDFLAVRAKAPMPAMFHDLNRNLWYLHLLEFTWW